jgi:hypothetical protein
MDDLLRSIEMGSKSLRVLTHKLEADKGSVLTHNLRADNAALPSVVRTLKVAQRTLLDMERLRASLARAIYEIDVLRAKNAKK